tara:strand:+ start:94 stop:738 length:645 start_codon:yes stop_codon:yes gene_type:complete
MDVNIKKDGQAKKYKVISKWADVSLDSWRKLVGINTEIKSSEALETIAELSNIPKDLINKLELSDVVLIMNKVSQLQQEQDGSLKRIVEIEGKRYGFHPDLDAITLGEYADVETYIQNDIEKNLPEVMAILYRPIVEETDSGVYTIEAYDGNISLRAEEMRKMSAEQVQSALVFFYNFGKVFMMITASFLTSQHQEMKEQLPQNPLRTNGHGSE